MKTFQEFLNETNDVFQADKAIRTFNYKYTSGEYTREQAEKELSKIIEKYASTLTKVQKKFASIISSVLPKKGVRANSIKVLHSLKTIESIINKAIDRKKNIIEMGDLVRGAILFDDEKMMTDFINDFKRKHNNIIIEVDTKKKGGDKVFGYYGPTHFGLKIDGIEVELQVMPRRMWSYKEAAHQIYNKWRTDIGGITRTDQVLSKTIFKLGNMKKTIREALDGSVLNENVEWFEISFDISD